MHKPTQRQIKLIKLIKENLGTPNNTKSMGALMLEAGYSKKQSENPFMVLESKTVQNELGDFLGMLDDKRRMAITHITKEKLKKSSGRDLAYITDVFTKNHQLLTGGSTERVAVVEISKEVAEKNDIDAPSSGTS